MNFMLTHLNLRGAFARWMGMILLMCCTFASAWGGERVLDAGLAPNEPVSLTDYFSVLEDPSQELTLNDVTQTDVAALFKAVQTPAASLNWGYTRSAYWMRLRLRNGTNTAVHRLIEVAYPLLSSIDLIQPQADRAPLVIATGNAKPFATRPYNNRNFIFPIRLAPQSEQVFYFRIQTESALVVPARLWVPELFPAHERDDYAIQAWYFGMASAMVLFNLLLYFSMREKIHLLYVGFVTLLAVTLASQNGLAKQYLWPDTTLWSNIALFVGYSLTMVVFIFFSRRMLETARVLPRVDPLLRLLAYFLLLTPFAFAVALAPLVKFAALSYGGSALALMLVGVACAVQRQRSAYFFVTAFAFTIFGGLMVALRGFGLVPANALTVNGLQIGSALEMVLLAIALADRFNEIRKEKDHAQKEMLLAQSDRILAEERVIENLRESERMLEARVTERTVALTATIERLEKTRAELVQAEKLASLGSLVAGIAHELNTPIGISLTTASTLEVSARELKATVERGEMRKSTLTRFVDNTQGMADLLLRTAQRAAGLVSSFKQVAVDQTTEQRREFDLRKLVEDNIAALQPSYNHVPCTVEVQVAADIVCDSYPGPLGHIIAILFQNAMNHAFEDQADARLAVTALERGDMVEMVFADTGVGMEPGILIRIFEPFFTTRLGHGGSGLGLSIASNIASGVLGGSLTASSTPGKGSRFVLCFPLTAPVNAA